MIYAAIFLMGCGLKIHFSYAYLLPLFLLFYTAPKRTFLSIPLLLAAYSYAPTDPCVKKPIYQEGVFTAHSWIKQNSHFRTSYKGKGTVQIGGRSWKANLYLPYEPKEIARYQFSGIIKQKRPFTLILYPKKPLQKIETLPFASAKKRLQKKLDLVIEKQIPEKEVAHFLQAFFFGNQSDPFLRYAFRSLGLSHILAISGLHFCLLAGIFFTLWKWLTNRTIALSLSIFCIVIYGFFIDSSPSSIRALCMIVAAFTAELTGKKTRACNLLAFACLVELTLNPLSLITPSFQLSFSSCTALLFFQKPCMQAVQRILGSSSSFQGPFFQKVSVYLQEALAASFAIYLVSGPLVLCHFSTLSLSSLFYNLFAPLLIVCAMTLWAIFWPLCGMFTIKYFLILSTKIALSTCLYPPYFMRDWAVFFPLPVDFVILWISMLLFIGFTLQARGSFGYDTI